MTASEREELRRRLMEVRRQRREAPTVVFFGRELRSVHARALALTHRDSIIVIGEVVPDRL